MAGDEHGAPITLDIDGVDVRVTSPEKVFFPKRGETKLDLVEYYLAVAEPFMRVVGGRPLLLERYPDGARGKSFFQKRVPKGAPDWLRTTEVSTPNGTTSNALIAYDMAHIAWAVNMGCLGFHVWPYRAADPEHADELRIDLDPQPGTNFDDVRAAALEVNAVLEELGIVAWPKTSGSKGIHIYVRLEPRWDSYQVRYAAVALARVMQRRRPDLLTCEWWKEERGERIFVDFNQNAPHKTVFGTWSVRPRVGGQVSMPITWEEVDTVEPEELTLATVPGLLAERGDPWAALDDELQSLEPLLEWHERDWADGLLDAPWPPVYPKQPNEPPRVSPSRAKKPDA
ncbi:MAG: non-homologous end-joining DNA ligase [Acidimicrobiales bacterium]|nr:non-homologous end-joining DNA ligase [Acidimicrobiales bacterium]